MYTEFFSGLAQDPAAALSTEFEETHHEIIILKDIRFNSICEHHFLPFQGMAHVGYIPNGKVAGLSKIARALDILALRPQIQERLTTEFANVIFESLKPEGIYVIICAEHMCMTVRGVKKPESKIITSASRGILKTDEAVKRDFLSMLGEI